MGPPMQAELRDTRWGVKGRDGGLEGVNSSF